MAEDSTAPSWQYADSVFSFAQQGPAHIPRGWERAPQPSHLARHKGRKVWKRPEPTRVKGDAEKLELHDFDEQRNPLRDVSTNTPRPIKRLRAKDGLVNGGKNEGAFSTNYFTTLHDTAIETPKRKYTSKVDDGTQNASQKAVWLDNDEWTMAGEVNGDSTRRAEIIENQQDICAKNGIEVDVLPAYESRAQKSVRSLLQSNAKLPLDVENEVEDLETEVEVPIDQALCEPDDKILLDEKGDVSSRDALQEEVGKRRSSTESELTNLWYEKAVTAIVKTPDAHFDSARNVETNAAEEFAAKMGSQNQSSQADIKGTESVSRFGIESPQDLQSPQIGTTLLRRESLRSRASPRKRGSAQESKTPQKRQGLKKRDTLQEREILQQFNATASPTQTLNIENLSKSDGETCLPKVSTDEVTIATETAQSNDIPCQNFKDESAPEIDTETQGSDIVCGQKIVDSQDLARAVQAIQVCQSSNDEVANSPHEESSPSLARDEPTDQNNDLTAESEVDEAMQTTEKTSENSDNPVRKTRSGARISDDTSVLKDFLNRAQAKKAAKTVPSLSAGVPKPQSSPTRRSPRKALGPQYGHDLSPRKSRPSARGLSTPPRKVAVDEMESSDEHDTIPEPSSFRRSTRTRFPAPAKTPPGVPSFIPVRRGDGSDQVVLQKSHAQEMAIVTRANTRRNKGQSKPPALALQDLPVDSPIKLTAKERAERAKTVAWAEKLASYSESKDNPDEPGDQRPKVRRMRGLGAVNGTPAKKSTAAVPASNGTPAPKRRSKTK